MTFGVGVAVAVAVAVGLAVGSLLGDAAGVAVTTGVGVLSAGTVVFCAIFFLIVTVMVPTFLVFFFNFSFTAILTLPAFFAVITPDLLTEAFLLEALKEYFAFFFFDLFLLADGSPIDMGFLELPEPVPEERVLRMLALRIGIDDGLGLGTG